MTKEEQRIYNKEYREKNREKLALKDKERKGINSPNREAYLEYQKEYSKKKRDLSYRQNPEWKAKHSAYEKARMAKLRLEKPEVVREQQRERVKKFKENNLEKVRLGDKIKLLKNRYNMSLGEYLEMAKSQNYCCKICSMDFSEDFNGNYEDFLRDNRRRLIVDHCHVSNRVRGLLCDSCNNGLGSFKDTISSLENAILYLRESYDDNNLPKEEKNLCTIDTISFLFH